MRINNILVPTDFSENAQLAFDHAHELALQAGAKLHLLHVRDESVLRTAVREGLVQADSTDDDLQLAVEQLTGERFSSTVAGVDQSAVVIECVSRRGDPKLVIADYASEVKADIVVVGTRGAGVADAIKTAVLGSVADSLIRRSPCPVLVVRPDHGRGNAEQGNDER